MDLLADDKADAPSHFLGSVVLAPGPDLAPNRSQWIVVDGQQRLTTLMLALCALRDHLIPEDPTCRDRINELHLINKFQSGDLRYRLLPTQADRDAFKACVDGVQEGRSGSLVGHAYQYFRTVIEEFDDPADPHDIGRVESVLLDRLNLVQITVEKDDNAFRIFESINNTGMRLSQVDLIRTTSSCVSPHGAAGLRRPLEADPGPPRRQGHGTTDVPGSGARTRRHAAQYNAVYRGHQGLLQDLGRDEARIEAYVVGLHRRARHLHAILDPQGEARSPTGCVSSMSGRPRRPIRSSCACWNSGRTAWWGDAGRSRRPSVTSKASWCAA